MPTNRRAGAARPVTIDQANARIAELRRLHVPPRSEREDLDAPLDADIRVTPTPPRHRVELVLGGAVVSWLTVIDFTQQIGAAALRMGGIAGVGTHNEHRFKGYSRRVIENSLRWMRREGFATSMLFGIPGYYPKYGFAPALPESSFTIATRDAERVEPTGLRFVDMRPRHVPAVLTLYHACIAGRIGPVHRPPGWAPRRGMTSDARPRVRVGVDRRDRVAAYAVLQQDGFTTAALEVGWPPGSAAVMADLLHEAARLAVEQRVEHVRVTLPEAHPFSEFCRPLGVRHETQCVRDGRAMVRMIDSAVALRSIAGELAARIDRGGAALRGGGELSIRTNLDAARLRWGGGRVSVEDGAGRSAVALPQWALAQMLYGYRGAASLAHAGVLRGPREAAAALDALFPARPALFHDVDHF